MGHSKVTLEGNGSTSIEVFEGSVDPSVEIFPGGVSVDPLNCVIFFVNVDLMVGWD